MQQPNAAHLVGKHGAVDDVPDSVHIIGGGLEALVNLDAAALVQLHAHALQP